MGKEESLVITLVGAESSGKTVLAKQLADALSCVWVQEYSREYLERLNRPYVFEDLEEIAKGQWEMMAFSPGPLTNLPPRPYEVLPPRPLKGVNENLEMHSLKNIKDFIEKIKALNRKTIIVDSGMLTIRMWARIKYNRTIPFVEEMMKQDPTSLYLLCRPRMEWENDPLREAPMLVERVWIYNQYLKEMVMENFNYSIITS